MTDAKTAAALADDSASADEKTDEQVWDDIQSEEPDAKPADDHDDGKQPELDGDDEPGDPDPKEPTDDDPTPSKDDDPGEGDDDKGDPAGMDPEALQAQVERLQHSLDSEKGRTAQNRREIVDLRASIASAPEPAQKGDQDDDHLKEKRDKLDAAQEEYGDVIGPVTATIKDLEARVDELTAQEARNLDQQRERYKALVVAEQGVFEKEHPDGFDTIIKNRQVFDGWIEDQPKNLRDIYADNQQAIVDGTQAALLVGRFKQALLDADGGPAPAHHETEKLQTKRRRQLAGARSIRSTGRQEISSRPAADSDDPQAHWDYFARNEARSK